MWLTVLGYACWLSESDVVCGFLARLCFLTLFIVLRYNVPNDHRLQPDCSLSCFAPLYPQSLSNRMVRMQTQAIRHHWNSPPTGTRRSCFRVRFCAYPQCTFPVLLNPGDDEPREKVNQVLSREELLGNEAALLRLLHRL